MRYQYCFIYMIYIWGERLLLLVDWKIPDSVFAMVLH